MCTNFRELNENTKLDVFPLPRIAALFDRHGNAKYFTSKDLATAYHKVRIADGDTHKKAFLTNKVLYDYTVIPFGLCNASETF